MDTLTTVEVSKKLNIPRSSLYYLMNTGQIVFPVKKSNHSLWTPKLISKLQTLIEQKNLPKEQETILPYKTTEINNRRYLGNKYKLLPFIKKVINDNCNDIDSVADIFAGTGAVSMLFNDRKIITNDMMYSNFICHLAWFGSENISQEKIIGIIKKYNALTVKKDNYMSKTFANTYFSLEVCRKIGYIREDIEKLHKKKKVNARERAVLITSLLYATDRIANTCGHYDAYLKSGDLNRKLELSVPTVANNLNNGNKCFNADANSLVKDIKADLVYIDPPYNSRQYCDLYHLVENIARWNKPKVDGVAKKMGRDNLKSDYCTQKAPEVFEKLISNIDAKYILLSYNNMANKGNARSNAKISDTDIMKVLSKKGKVKTFSQKYKSFTAGKSDIQENEERLFLCVCETPEYGNPLVQSPLNYTGGKFQLLPQILPHFPTKIDNFVDLFCGGANVGVNVNHNKVILNDKEQYIPYMFSAFKNLDNDVLFDMIYGIIDKYELSLSSKYGYKKYNCNSADGLGSYNKDKFLKLRKDFNNYKSEDYYYYVLLYVLIVYSFNNQIRFNSKGEFNLPVGKRDFNTQMVNKLNSFVYRLKNNNYVFTSMDFRKFDMKILTKDSFVYCDPPYLITCASYNEQNGWTSKDEKDLLNFLDFIDAKKVKFALSNVLRSKGKENSILLDWIDKRKYKVIKLSKSYANSNYHTKDKTGNSEEVLIVNY
ncbi:MAG: Dam family site-specific DNA-(adenine-N6)-methyltransferase [Endomicrobiaceae bacterium]|nr:Dam family site-specific DNA-(adenine-N6)-methyltransferase [Endomicrobiaceae bacterium]